MTRSRQRVLEAVTLARLPLAVALPFVSPTARGAVFVVAAATDVVDGPLARRWGLASERGARLDTLADAALVAGTTAAVASTVDPAASRLVAAGTAAVASIRLVNLVVTRARFGRWSIAHTRANKASGLLLALVGAWALVAGHMPVRVLAAAGGLAGAAALEELAVVVSADEYDADVSGFRRRAS